MVTLIFVLFMFLIVSLVLPVIMPLVSVAAPEFLASAVAESVQFPLSGFSAQEQLLNYLSERSTLLVLDNFEHLVDGSGLLGELIERAPGVELLTTSRERLNVQSEWVYDVEGLGLAENGNGGGGALRLFVERAVQARPGFELDGEERLHALRICRLVTGMPLGIELAAAWVSMLSCGEIADEIERNVDFLATSMRDVPDRHRSLRAVFDQSWRLLSDEQREIFKRMQALMSLLEGHASFVMNEVARDHVSDVDRMRRALSSRRRASSVERTFQKAIGFEQKIRQYDSGERFVRAIVDRSGMSTFNLVWRSATDLPTIDEIGQPDRWLARVGG